MAKQLAATALLELSRNTYSNYPCDWRVNCIPFTRVWQL